MKIRCGLGGVLLKAVREEEGGSGRRKEQVVGATLVKRATVHRQFLPLAPLFYCGLEHICCSLQSITWSKQLADSEAQALWTIMSSIDGENGTEVSGSATFAVAQPPARPTAGGRHPTAFFTLARCRSLVQHTLFESDMLSPTVLSQGHSSRSA